MAIYPQAPPLNPNMGNKPQRSVPQGSPPFNPNGPVIGGVNPGGHMGGGSPPFNPNLPHDVPMPSNPFPSAPMNPAGPASSQVDPSANAAFLDRWRAGNRGRIPLNTQGNGGASTLPPPMLRGGRQIAPGGGRFGNPMGAPEFMRPISDTQNNGGPVRYGMNPQLGMMRETPWLHASQAPNGRLPQQAPPQFTGQVGESGYPDWFEYGMQQHGMSPDQAAAAWAAGGNAPIGQIAVSQQPPQQAPQAPQAPQGRGRAPLGEGMQYRPRGGQRPMNPGGMQSMPVGVPQPAPMPGGGMQSMPQPQIPQGPFNPYYGGYGF